MENISDDEPTVIGDTSPMCWSTHNNLIKTYRKRKKT